MPRRTPQERLDALCDFVADLDGLGGDELDEQLRLDGIEPDEVVARVLDRVRAATGDDDAS